MPFILLTNKYPRKQMDIIHQLLPQGFTVKALKNLSKDELLQEIPYADYLLASGRVAIDCDVISAAVNLKMIQRTGVGVDNFDIDFLKEKSIPVYVNRGINSNSVAEHTLLLILGVLKNVIWAQDSMRKGDWLKQSLGIECNDLKGKSVGLVGLGEVGTEVARILNIFGAKVYYYDCNMLCAHEAETLNVTYIPFEEMLKIVDILSLHCPLNTNTHKMIGKSELELMRRGAILINTSRGKLIDEDELVLALKSKHLRGAGLDVFYDEPINLKNELIKLDNVILTPHIAGVTYESFYSMIKEAMYNIFLFEQGCLSEIEDKKLALK